MKISVALEFTNACTENLEILVVPMEIKRYKKVPWALRAFKVEYRESLFFHLE